MPLLSLGDKRSFLVVMLLLKMSLSLFLTAMGPCAIAFSLQEPQRATHSSLLRYTHHSSLRNQEKRSWQHYSTKQDLTTISSNATRSSDVPFPDNKFVVEIAADVDAPTLEMDSEAMTLVRNGNRLELSSTNNDQPSVVLFDGLPPNIWTTGKPPVTAAAAASSTSSSFSSLVLQTKVPSVAIESLSMGNFMVVEDAAQQQQKPHKHKFLAAARLNRYWMGPKFGGEDNDNEDGDRDEIPVDTQYLLIEVDREAQSLPPCYVVMMPLVDGGYRSSLEPSSSSIGENFRDKTTSRNKLTLVSYSESGDNLSPHDQTANRNAMYVAVHDDPYELLQVAFREVSEVLGGTFRTLDDKQIPSQFVDSFGWCSWDAFYSKVHPSGILEGVKCLADAGVPVKNVILDDGWQQVSPPYLHQQEEADDQTKTRTSLAASLSLSGSSDIMPPPNSVEVSSSGTAVISTTYERASVKSSTLSAIVSSARALLQNPLETLSGIGESLFGVVASGVTKCYQNYVEITPAGSLPRKVWTFLARNTPLNNGLWAFFDSETDFGRQLNDFAPNWKFLEEPETGTTKTTSKTKKTNIALKELVGTLKDELNVNKVYCWHSIHGYWRGVSDELGKSIGIDVTQVRTRPSDHVLRIEPEMAYDPPSLFGVGLIGNKNDLSKFYKHLHETLADAGVDGVKIDVQSGITAAGMRGKNDFPPMAKLYTQTMEDSVSRMFPSASDDSSIDAGAVECINCMCHSTENLYRYKTTAVARASDDFYPARPESHSVHLVNVAYNSLFLGEICLPDWDMFHSRHASAELHAAARAIGGCPVYVSDVPGEHNIPLLKKLVLPDGSVLRAKKSGRPTRDCIFADVGKDGSSALKIWNINRGAMGSSSVASGGVVGAFNVQGVSWNWETNENQVVDPSPPSVKASIRPHDVDSLRSIDGPFAVWSHRTKSLTVLPEGGSAIQTSLEPRDWEIFTIQPVQETEDSAVRWAPIGLGHMLNSGGAILDVDRLSVGDDGNEKRIQAHLTTRGPGSFVAFCQPRPSSVMIRSGLAPKSLEFQHNPQSGVLEFKLPPETIEGKAHFVTVVWEQ